MRVLRGIKSVFGAFSRSLDAASHGRPLKNAGTIDNLNSDIASGTHTIRRRAAYLSRNSPHIVAAVNVLVSNIVGPGIRPVSQHPDPAMKDTLHDLWDRFVDEADADGQTDLYGLQALMVRQMVESGESFARFRPRLPTDGLTVPFQVQALHPSHCPIDTIPLETSAGAYVRCGIEFDQLGRRSAYYFWNQRPDDPFAPLIGTQWKPVRVLADDAVHLFDPLEPGQLRGLSWLNATVAPTTELDAFQAAALKRAQLANMIVGAVVDAQGQAGGIPGVNEGGVFASSLQPGAFLNLPPGKHVEFFDPKESQHYGAFVKAHLKAMSCAIGVPYELLSHDLADVNYSSIRAGIVEFRKRLEHWQHNVVVFRLCRPVWDRFIRMAVLSGHIPAAAYAADPRAFHKAVWLPPKQEWVDPKSDAEAEALMVEKGFKSRRMVVASLGYDLEQIDADRAADQAAPQQTQTEKTAP